MTEMAMDGGYGNLGYGSGASSIRDENSSTNLLSLDNSDESNLANSSNDVLIINGKRINNNNNVIVGKDSGKGKC